MVTIAHHDANIQHSTFIGSSQPTNTAHGATSSFPRYSVEDALDPRRVIHLTLSESESSTPIQLFQQPNFWTSTELSPAGPAIHRSIIYTDEPSARLWNPTNYLPRTNPKPHPSLAKDFRPSVTSLLVHPRSQNIMVSPISRPPAEDALSIPIHQDDLESGADGRLKRSASKVTLPYNVQNGDAPETPRSPNAPSDVFSQMEWGPEHPCYPHLNPHVPLDSPLYSSSRIVRIPRDWLIAGDIAPTFANIYPEVLVNVMSEEEFRNIIRHVNEELLAAFDPFSWTSWLDSVLGVATFWLWEDAGLTSVKRKLKNLEDWLELWNQKVGAKEAVKIIPLRRTAYMTLDIQIPDPHISPAAPSIFHASLSQLPTSA